MVAKRISGHAYKLVLPPTMRIHPGFHLSLLEPTATDPFESQGQPEPLPIIVNDHAEWEVKEILDAKTYYQKPQFLVKWTNTLGSTWKLPESVRNAPLKVRKFYHRYPNKPFLPLLDDDPDSDADD